MRETVVRTGEGRFGQQVEVGPHRFVVDEPSDLGGTDTGAAPFEHLLAGLGACTSMTVKAYADRKGWPLERVEVRLTHTVDATGLHIRRSVQLFGALDDAQRQRLLEIANRCPVHRALNGPIDITTGGH